MTQPLALRVEDALDELVNQFSDPFSFLRELVQNSLDAGSEDVEIAIDYEPGEGGTAGMAVIRVDDWGDGMDREIISKKLTRLFSSGKDGDMTKIGKFGIGFVSVFAIAPDAVCVDTSRDGENWRILFDDKRDFKLLRLPDPVDGTKIRIFKSLEASEFPGFVARARSTLSYWCKHTRGEIRFCGETVNEAFDLPGSVCRVQGDDGFSRVVLGHPLDSQAFFGFYNSGLTLAEGEDHTLTPLAFKASSPHLEHTLTRDNVIQDAGYARVLDSVAALADGPLRQRVFAALEEDLGRRVPSELRGYLFRAATWHLARGAAAHEGNRVVAQSPSGRQIQLRELGTMPKGRVVLSCPNRSSLSEAAEAAGYTVVTEGMGSDAEGFIRSVAPPGVHFRLLAQTFVVASPVSTPADQWAPLMRGTQHLLEQHGVRLTSVEAGSFAYPDSPITDRVAITQRQLGELTPLEDSALVTRGIFAVRRVCVVNVDHPIVRSTATIAARQPGLAAYLLAKAFLLGSELEPKLDGELADLAMRIGNPT